MEGIEHLSPTRIGNLFGVIPLCVPKLSILLIDYCYGSLLVKDLAGTLHAVHSLRLSCKHLFRFSVTNRLGDD